MLNTPFANAVVAIVLKCLSFCCICITNDNAINSSINNEYNNDCDMNYHIAYTITIDYVESVTRKSLLHLASERNDKETVEYLVKEGHCDICELHIQLLVHTISFVGF